ncbi:MAG TPA: methyltransferase domain-containing protein [Acidobacteriota bacterium]|nr:methyltransferase domain-containing protein [Acidobacteriota bacterium]
MMGLAPEEPVTSDQSLLEYFEGARLYGDDWNPDAIKRWFEEEREAYAELGAKDRSTYRYPYRALDERHLFRHLPPGRFPEVLSVGGAYGDELLPLSGRMSRATIVEASERLKGGSVGGTPVQYVAPDPQGGLPFDSESFDLVCCLSTLHHIPNVTAVLREMARVVRGGGVVLLREPTTSMGDWRIPRRGLTKNERGIPLDYFRTAIRGANLRVLKETRCMNALTPRLGAFLRRDAYNSRGLVLFDEFVNRLLDWNKTYHARGLIQRVRPWSVAYVLQK